MKSLLGFMSELCFCSHKELLTIFPRKTKTLSTKIKQRQSSSGGGGVVGDGHLAISLTAANDALLFHRISEAMLKCVKSGRPLLHIVKAWAIVGPHLMEVCETNFVKAPYFDYTKGILGYAPRKESRLNKKKCLL